MTIQYRNAPTEDGLQHRFVELRYDGDRTLSGVAMRYGEVATLPWGEKERFTANAFGDLRNADVILDFQHQRARPLARTGGGGLELMDSSSELSVNAKLPNTRDADDALELVRTKVLRGFSVAFKPISHRKEDGVTVIDKADLIRIGLVDIPAYKNAKVNARQEGDDMNEEQIRALVEELMAQRNADEPVDAAALATQIASGLSERMTETVREQVSAAVATAMEERDEAQRQAEEAAEAQRQAEEQAQADREQAEQDAEERADLIVMVRELLPSDFETRGQANHAIMVAAVGDEVKDAENRSADYLMAKLEGIVERRAAAKEGMTAFRKPVQTQQRGMPLTGTGNGATVLGMIGKKRVAERSA